jgi:hypothetical protein
MVTEQDLIEIFCPPKNLQSVIPQFYPEVRDLTAFRKGEIPNPKEFSDANELRAYVRTQIQQSRKGVIVSTPFDLLTRIHYTEGRLVPAPKGTEPREVTEVEEFREISAPFHTRDGKEHTIQTKYRAGPRDIANPAERGAFITAGQDTSKEALERDFIRLRSSVQQRRREMLEQQYATYNDMIVINRRLIDLDVRCQRCTGSDRIACFKYDWIERKLLE